MWTQRERLWRRARVEPRCPLITVGRGRCHVHRLGECSTAVGTRRRRVDEAVRSPDGNVLRPDPARVAHEAVDRGDTRRRPWIYAGWNNLAGAALVDLEPKHGKVVHVPRQERDVRGRVRMVVDKAAGACEVTA